MTQTSAIVSFLESDAPYTHIKRVDYENSDMEELAEAQATNLWWITYFRNEKSLSMAPLTPAGKTKNGEVWSVVNGDIPGSATIMKRTIRKSEETIYELQPLTEEHLKMFPQFAVGLKQLLENDWS